MDDGRKAQLVYVIGLLLSLPFHERILRFETFESLLSDRTGAVVTEGDYFLLTLEDNGSE